MQNNALKPEAPIVKLNAKQEAFAMGYVEFGDATKARRLAGYSTRMKINAQYVDAHRLLNHPKISVRVEQIQAEARKRNALTIDHVIERLRLIAFANFEDFHQINPATGLPQLDLNQCDDKRKLAALSGVKVRTYVERGADGEFEEVKEVEAKFYAADAALINLGKYLGMFREDPPVTQINLVVTGDDARL